jgi:hypothetical protein
MLSGGVPAAIIDEPEGIRLSHEALDLHIIPNFVTESKLLRST